MSPRRTRVRRTQERRRQEPAQPRSRREWWERPGAAYEMHPASRARLGLTSADRSGGTFCTSCGKKMSFAPPDQKPFCTKDCRKAFYGLIDAICASCGAPCCVRPGHSHRPFCANCRHRHRD